MSLSKNIRYLRKKQGWGQDVLAEKLGYKSYTTIQKWESGVSEPPLKSLHLLASLFHVDINDLASIDLESASLMNRPSAAIPQAANIIPLPRMKQWKVLGGTACGEPIFKELDDETILAPDSIDADFVFRCVGDSMINARIFDGDIVFVKSGVEVENGQIAVVRIDDEYTLKRIYHGPDYLELRSENPMYPARIIRGEQENAEIVGRAVQFLSRVI